MAETGPEPTLSVCAKRGFHGPFANRDKYDAVPGWEGLADCLACGTTCRVEGPTPVAEIDPSLPDA